MLYRNQFKLFSLIVLICIGVHFSSESIRDLLLYKSSKVSDGEIWRLLTGHFVHSNSMHLLMNLSAFALLLALLPIYQSFSEGALIILGSGTTVCLIYLVLHSEDVIYVGLSSVLHSLAIVGGLKLLSRDRHIALILIAFICVKVVYENICGASTNMTELIEARVAVESHLYGVIAGCIIALVLKYLNLFRVERISV